MNIIKRISILSLILIVFLCSSPRVHHAIYIDDNFNGLFYIDPLTQENTYRRCSKASTYSSDKASVSYFVTLENTTISFVCPIKIRVDGRDVQVKTQSGQLIPEWYSKEFQHKIYDKNLTGVSEIRTYQCDYSAYKNNNNKYKCIVGSARDVCHFLDDSCRELER
jgi:hypothetical protein